MQQLRQQIEAMIANDLTIGRTDNGLNPFTDIQIMEFIADNQNNISRLINNIIIEYADNIRKNSNYEFEYSQIREFFYEEIDTGVR